MRVAPALRELITVEDLTKEGACINMDISLSQDLIDDDGLIHGGMLALIMSIGAEELARQNLARDGYLIVSSASINYLKQAIAGDVINIRACIAGKSERMMLVDVDANVAGEHVAKALYSFIIEEE